MERVLGLTAVLGRVGQKWHEPIELGHSTRPAMGEQQRRRLRMRRTVMADMDRGAADLCAVLRHLVEDALGCAPVVLIPPVVNDASQQLPRTSPLCGATIKRSEIR